MKKIIIIGLLTAVLLSTAVPASAYTLSGSISGGVFLGGITYVIAVSFDSASYEMYLGLVLFGNGSYRITDIPAGQCIIVAFQDRDNNVQPSTGDYFGWYGQQLPEIVNVTGNMSNLDIQIAPLPTTQIAGAITYNGPLTGLTLVEAATDPQFTQNQFYSIVLDSTGNGAYTVFLDPGVYYVRAFLDSNLNLAYDPGEPYGYYGYPGAPASVNVTSVPAQGIDFALYDPAGALSLTLAPVGAPVVIPPTGGSFEFSVQLANNGNSPENVDAWIDVVLPNGNPYRPLLNRALTVPAGAQIVRMLNQTVPGIAPPGQYWYRGFVGNYPNIIAAADSFFFNKMQVDDGDSAEDNWDIEGWDGRAESVPPETAILLPAYPNPFNQTTALSFKLQAAGQVRLDVFDLAGREVATLADGSYSAGTHTVDFDASGLPTGMYFIRLFSGGTASVQKVLLMK